MIIDFVLDALDQLVLIDDVVGGSVSSCFHRRKHGRLNVASLLTIFSFSYDGLAWAEIVPKLLIALRSLLHLLLLGQ